MWGWASLLLILKMVNTLLCFVSPAGVPIAIEAVLSMLVGETRRPRREAKASSCGGGQVYEHVTRTT